MAKRKRTGDSKFQWILIVGGFLTLASLLIFTYGDASETGPIGDTIGGITAPIIGFMSAILIYISFREQIRANELLASFRKEDVLRNDLNDFLRKIEAKFDVLTFDGNPGEPANGVYAFRNFITLYSSYLRCLEMDLSIVIKDSANVSQLHQSKSRVGKAMRGLVELDTKSSWILHFIKYISVFFSHLERIKRESQVPINSEATLRIYEEEYLVFHYTYLSSFMEEFIATTEKVEVFMIQANTILEYSLDEIPRLTAIRSFMEATGDRMDSIFSKSKRIVE